jgi:hypothetical protein
MKIEMSREMLRSLLICQNYAALQANLLTLGSSYDTRGLGNVAKLF